ncbi:phage portal protein, partial [Clostridium sp. CMCC3678]
AYIDEQGQFKTMIIPSEQCIPVWKDRSHTELDTMIRIYETIVWEYDRKKTVTNVEVWTSEGVTYYRLDGKLLVMDYEKSNEDNNGPVAHYK